MKKIKLAETPTPIQFYSSFKTNDIYIKRDDLTDLSLGGNKVRKLEYFLADALEKKADCIVTYGSVQSNHCRLTAAAASRNGLKTVLLLSKSNDLNFNGNYFLYDLFDAEVVWVDTHKVPETIEETLTQLKNKGYNPYFIQGGGHGNLGTHAYKLAFDEILNQEKENKVDFDYIFHASGTGTTQAGLIAGNIINQSMKKIVGISIARNKDRGTQVILDSLKDYLGELGISANALQDQITFNDSYIGNGYANIYKEVLNTIRTVAKHSGILLDPVYTGKAFHGMLDYIKVAGLKNNKVLFIHTGGSPLLFNYANKFKEE